MTLILPPFVERSNFNRRFEPVGNIVLHGAGQDPGVGNPCDPSPFHNYWQAMGEELYPGDDWVDWWSIDLFSPEMFTRDNTNWFLEDAATHRFPVMIGEFTPRQIGGLQQVEEAWAKWFEPFFWFTHVQSTIKAFCYINWAWDNYPGFQWWGDARIEIKPFVLDRYKHELANPWYEHAQMLTGVDS